MHIKTVCVTNPRNVLVQVPSFVIADWQIYKGAMLEVHYDGDAIIIKPTVQRRITAIKKDIRMAGATPKIRYKSNKSL